MGTDMHINMLDRFSISNHARKILCAHPGTKDVASVSKKAKN